MSLLDNISIKDGIDTLGKRLFPKKPRGSSPEDVRAAVTANDFPGGFVIQEYQNGQELVKEKIQLLGNLMIHAPFEFGGKQRLRKNYYPGNSEPTVQVLGAEEKNIKVTGRFYDKRYEGKRAEEGSFYGVAYEFQQQINAIRTRGNLVRITMGEFKRWGFIEDASFKMKTLGDLDYEIDFLIVGNNPPKGSKAVDDGKEFPVAINKELIAAATKIQTDLLPPPSDMPKSFADQITGLISDVSESIGIVTTFVDGILQEVDDVKSGVNRALGLVKFARNKALTYKRIVGGFPALITAQNPGIGISQSYLMANYVAGSLAAMGTLTAILARLQAQLKSISKTVPLARHRVKDGDNLQKIALKFYNSSDDWKLIYDHNKLLSTTLTRGQVLEIPRN